MLSFSEIEERIQIFFQKLPSVSENKKMYLVQIMPYLSLFSACATILFSGILYFATNPSLAAHSQNFLTLVNFILKICMSFIFAYIFFASYLPLKKKLISGWKSLYFATLLITLYSIFATFLFGIIFSFVFLYLLFQIKSYYK